MKYLALTVLLAVMQTAPPVPRKAADNSAQAAARIKSESTPNQTKSPEAPAPLKTDGNGPSKSNSGEQGQNNTEHSVGISKLPPVSVAKDWADWGVWAFSLLLVVVGGLQVLLLCWTLHTIRRQAAEMLRQRILMRKQWKEMSQQTASLKEYVDETRKIAGSGEDSAKAALLNAEALINAERPWVMVQIKELPGENAAKTNFQFDAFNYGDSPAHIVSCKGPIATWCDDPDRELPIPPDYGTWDWDTRFLAPKDSFPMRDSIEPWGERLNFVKPRAMQGISTPGKSHLVIYGLLEYRDGVTETVHRTAFCYRRKREKLSDMGGHLVPCGPRVYNEYT